MNPCLRCFVVVVLMDGDFQPALFLGFIVNVSYFLLLSMSEVDRRDDDRRGDDRRRGGDDRRGDDRGRRERPHPPERIFVGNLPSDVKERELDDLFYKYGRIHRIEIVKKDRKAFAFIDFSERERGAAEDAIYGRDRVLFDGGRLTVERSGSRRREEARDRKREPRGPITRTQFSSAASLAARFSAAALFAA